MAKITRFEDLDCWMAARVLVKDVFSISSTGVLSKDWDTKSQFRRAAVSVMNNIAEGFCRFSDKEFVRFLDIAQSSAGEVKSMLYLFEDIEYFDLDTLDEFLSKVDKARNLTLGMLRYLIKKHNIDYQPKL